MFRQLDTAAYDALLPAPSLPVRPGDRAHWPPAGGVVPDHEVPLFALVRSTRGLPRDDRRWWPEVDGVFTATLPATFPTAAELSFPTLALLERALAGLQSWDALSRR